MLPTQGSHQTTSRLPSTTCFRTYLCLSCGSSSGSLTSTSSSFRYSVRGPPCLPFLLTPPLHLLYLCLWSQQSEKGLKTTDAISQTKVNQVTYVAEVNKAEIDIIGQDGEIKRVRSSDLVVGDVVFVPEETRLPADMIVISTTHQGSCYIQTSSLDGEKNLKKKSIPKDFEQVLPHLDLKEDQNKIKSVKGSIKSEEPSPDLYDFTGSITSSDRTFALKADQLLLKGAVLKNTDAVIGIVVYTGKDTRLMQNQKPSRMKMSKVEEKMNSLVIGILVFQIILCGIISSIGIDWYIEFMADHTYIDKIDSTGVNWVKSFFRYFLLLNTLIPISLIVTLEVVKLFQAYFIAEDVEMFNEERGKLAKVSSASLNEELGQVEYIFSDKTGTLTKNVMEFKLCYVGGDLYGDGSILEDGQQTIQRQVTKRNVSQGTEYTFKNKALETMLFTDNHDYSTQCDYKIQSKTGNTQIQFNEKKDMAVEFLKLLSAAHECEPEVKMVDGQQQRSYEGPSPDEVTLVEFAQAHGYEFIFGNDRKATINIKVPDGANDGPLITNWKQVRTLEMYVYRRIKFNSTRKRMSIIVQDPDDGLYKLYCKGADSIIKERLDPDQQEEQTMSKINNFLEKASTKGFRTLLMAMRVLEQHEIDEFERDCQKAESDPATSETNLNLIYDRFERDLVIVGATCVEDRLQDDVPSTIKDLQNAGIKIWMLTGDKLETAENIGYSTNLFNENMHIIKCRGEEDCLKAFNKEEAIKNEKMIKDGVQRGLLIESGALQFILSNQIPAVKMYFLKISKSCEAVVCCRVSPLQKAEVVRAVKEDDTKSVTLAIGDGANDVSMIMEAHIGIGLYGNEGMNAVQASDYALGEFRFLRKLILFHGRWSYLRNSELILYFFYKNIVFTLPQIFFAFKNGYSGQTIYDDWYISFYNMFFTALPLMAKALSEQDINPNTDGTPYNQYLPNLYYVGQRSTIFNMRVYFVWLMEALFHSIIIFVFPIYAFDQTALSDSYNSDLWALSLASFTAMMFIVTFKLMVYERYFAWPNIFCILVLSLGIYFLYVFVSNETGFSNTHASMGVIFSSSVFYFTVVFCIGFAFFVDYGKSAWITVFQTSPTDYLRLMVKRGVKMLSPEQEKEFYKICRDLRQTHIVEDLRREREINRKRRRNTGIHLDEELEDELEELQKDQNISEGLSHSPEKGPKVTVSRKHGHESLNASIARSNHPVEVFDIEVMKSGEKEASMEFE